MIAIGLLLTLAGFLISLLSLTLTASVSGRLIIVLIGIALTLFGIIGIMNRTFMKKAIWRR